LERTTLAVERRDTALLITLHNPSGYPRLERAVLRELMTVVDGAAADELIRGIVIAGGQQAFCAGAALEEVGGLDGVTALRLSALGQQTMERIACSSKRVVAAIRGYCLGGGFDLALACHVRVAAPDASFGHPGGSLGTITGWGGTARLPRLIGSARAQEMFITGRRVHAGEALSWGLVRTIVTGGELLAATIELATVITEHTPRSG
jgi:enoyl-CoA hydratase/carnithine racemase